MVDRYGPGPEYTVANGVKAFEKDRIQPMYASANMGHPSRG